MDNASPDPGVAPAAILRRRLPDRVAATAVFLSAGAVLVLEVVGLRLVGPYLGVTLQTSSAVIGIALGAIAYGAWTGGWLADRADPRRLLPTAFLLAAIATALVLPTVRWSGELLRGGGAAGILILATFAVFVPATLLSAISPIVIKLQLSDVGHTGRVVGRLSGIGTLGGITATLVTGFVLVAALPSTVIVLGLAGILAGVGTWLYVYLRRRDPSTFHGARRPLMGLVLLLLAGTSLTVLAPNPCDIETAYHCARIEVDPDRPTGRLLRLNSARHSYVDLADPRHLEFAYTQWLGAVVDSFAVAGAPVRVLHIGGGGFTMPRYVAAARPGSFNRVLELDGELVALDRAELGVTPGPDLDIVVDDARMSLARQPERSFDLVIGDAFGHLAVPWHLTTKEFLEDIQRVLLPGGVYALNVIDYPPNRLVRAELATVRAVFAHVAVVAPEQVLAGGGRGSNFLVLASDQPLPLAQLRPLFASVAEPATVLDGPQLNAFIGDARVLTDDYAPVDQLLQ
jgi:spermidine synthase